ncbi:MAG: serine/threonine-protein kinase [Gemmatimonadales bacterium]
MTQVLCPQCGTAFTPGAVYCSKCGSAGPTQLSAERAQARKETTVTERLAVALGATYEVKGLLGSGGFAEVYELWDNDLHRRLAAKVLRPDVAWTSGMLSRFKQEARVLARLNHPNILPIHFIGEGEGLAFYVMPVVEGESLAQLLRRQGALSATEALTIARPILQALDHAHAAGLIHRDIKPDNILLEKGTGRVLLVDFGIAKLLDSGAPSHTQQGFVVGTPHYMSPEQALGQGDVDRRTDIYAFGAMLFQMVTGVPPYEGDSSQEIVGKHLADPIPAPVDRNAALPRWLSNVIVKCLAKRADDRYATAADVLAALNVGRQSGPQQVEPAAKVAARVRGDEATAILPSSGERQAAENGGQGKRKGRVFAITGGLLVLGLLGIGAVQFFRVPVQFENRLVFPVKVQWDGREAGVVASGGTLSHPVRRGSPATVQWYAALPSGAPPGEPIEGSVVIDKAARGAEVVASAEGAKVAMFAPLITNTTGAPLRVTVNPGSAAATDCRCSVPAGGTRMVIGYYRLFSNSSVAVTAPDGRIAVFPNVAASVAAGSGTVGLRFEAKDLRRP